MGRILTIRLSAVTFAEDDVAKTWPKLCLLAWPGQGEMRSGAWVRTLLPPKLAASVAVPRTAYGVRELAEALLEESRFGNWSVVTAQSLSEFLPNIEKSIAALETALGDWQPGAAIAASDALEDALDALERDVVLEN